MAKSTEPTSVSLTSTSPLPTSSELSWPAFPLGIGTGRLCSLNGGLPVHRATGLLRQAFDLGIRFFDTAPGYGQGQAEEAIGLLDPSIRNEILICTKVGYSLGTKGRLINLAKPVVQPILPWVGSLRNAISAARDRAGEDGGSMKVTITPDAIRTTLESSLRRLQRDTVDVFMMHDPSAESVESEANQQEMLKLVETGKIRCWGISTSDANVARRAASVPGCNVIEIPGYPAWVEANQDVYQECAIAGVDIVANGVLTPLTGRPHTGTDPGDRLTAAQCINYAFELPQTKVVLCGVRKSDNLNNSVEIMRRLVSI